MASLKPFFCHDHLRVTSNYREFLARIITHYRVDCAGYIYEAGTCRFCKSDISFLIEDTAPEGQNMKYKVIRFYKDAHPNKRTIKRGLTLKEAQAHCQDPETSSSTCTKSVGLRRTKRYGAWFDGYDEDN